MTAPMVAEPNPRTPDAPMAFTSTELTGGVIAAGVSFTLAAPALVLLVAAILDVRSFGFALMIVIYGSLLVLIPATVVMCFAFAPIARLAGRALRRETRRWPHLLVYAALGAAASIVAGVAVGAIFGALSVDGARVLEGIAFVGPWGGMLAPVAAGSAAFGWFRAARRALAADRRAAAAPETETAPGTAASH
ncbi:MAG: hypothetical protein QM598_10940 [Protaetiibacter sp.]